MDKRLLTLMIGIFAVLTLSILNINIVSALEFDNVKYYDNLKSEITFTNGFGLGSDIAKAKLDTPQINYVMAGKDRLVAEITINSYVDYANFIKQIQLINLNNGQTINRKVTYKYKAIEIYQIDVNDYKNNCKEVVEKNGTRQDCIQELVGSHKENKERINWLPLEKLDIKTGEMTIGIFADVYAGDNVEWYPDLFGLKVTEWATWTDSLSVNLLRYFKLNSNTKEEVFGLNGSQTSLTTNVTGIISGAIKVSDTSGNIIVGTIPIEKNWTVNFWLNFSDAGTTDKAFFSKDGSTQFYTQGGIFKFYDAGGDVAFNFDINSATNMIANSLWQMMTIQSEFNRTNNIFRLYINGTLKKEDVKPANAFVTNNAGTWGLGKANGGRNGDKIAYDEFGMWNRTLTSSEVADLYNGGAGLNYGATKIQNSIPINAQNISSSSVTFGCNATGVGGITSVTLNVTGATNWTQIISGLSVDSYNATFINSTLIDGNYSWFCIAYGDTTEISATWTFTKDATSPIISISNPSGNIGIKTLPYNITLNYNAIDSHLLNCSYNSTFNSTLAYVPCNVQKNIRVNSSLLTQTVYVYANDTFANSNSNSSSYSLIIENSRSFNPTASVLGSETFSINLSGTVDYARLVYNGTKYLMATSGQISSKTINIQSGMLGTQSFYFEVVSGGIVYNSTNSSQIVNNLTIQDCILGGIPIINISMKDEELNTLLNRTSPNVINTEIELTLTSLLDPTNFIEFSKTWNNNQTMAVCMNATNSTYQIDFTIGYSATDHVQEFYFMDNGTLNLNTGNFNAYTIRNISLMDLLSADSTTFLFEFTDANNLEVENALVHTFRKYIGEGLFREVERSKQDNNGQTHVHLVEEDVIYYFMITQYGRILFTSDTYNAKCLSTPCEISLTASPTQQNWSIIDNEGGQYSVSTDKTTRIVTTSFSISNLNLVNVSLYKVVDGEVTLINSSSLTSMSGSIDLHVPLSYGNATFFVAIYNNGEFVKSVWVSLTESARDYFGVFGAILGGLIVLAMMLMAVTEGAGFIIFTVLALIVVAIMQLIDLGWMALISIICAGAIIVWKLVNRRGSRQ